MLHITKDDVRGACKYYGLFPTEPGSGIRKEFILKTDNPDDSVLLYDYEDRTWQEMQRSTLEELQNDKELLELDETHGIWFLEFHHAFNGQGNDAAVNELLEKWTQEKEKYRAEFNYGWPAKYVETTFYLNGKQYSITPDSIGLEGGNSWDEGFLEFLQVKIGEDLENLGATEIRHMGFMD